jgi:hypothetical protein
MAVIIIPAAGWATRAIRHMQVMLKTIDFPMHPHY